MGYEVKYEALKSSGGRQEVTLIQGETKTLVYSKLSTKKLLDEVTGKEVAEKIKELVEK